MKQSMTTVEDVVQAMEMDQMEISSIFEGHNLKFGMKTLKS